MPLLWCQDGKKKVVDSSWLYCIGCFRAGDWLVTSRNERSFVGGGNCAGQRGVNEVLWIK
jgi:hypothetical protein